METKQTEQQQNSLKITKQALNNIQAIFPEVMYLENYNFNYIVIKLKADIHHKTNIQQYISDLVYETNTEDETYTEFFYKDGFLYGLLINQFDSDLYDFIDLKNTIEFIADENKDYYNTLYELQKHFTIFQPYHRSDKLWFEDNFLNNYILKIDLDLSCNCQFINMSELELEMYLKNNIKSELEIHILKKTNTDLFLYLIEIEKQI
jgi:hypothetical protein